MDQVQIRYVMQMHGPSTETDATAAKYFAFCRHSGDWKDPSKNNVQWNVQIVDLIADDMMNAFTEVKKAFNEIQAKLIHKLDSLLEELDTDLHGESLPE